MKNRFRRKFNKFKNYQTNLQPKHNKNMNKLYKIWFSNMISRSIIYKNNYNFKIDQITNKIVIVKNLQEHNTKALIVIQILQRLQYNKAFIEKWPNFQKIQMILKNLILKKGQQELLKKINTYLLKMIIIQVKNKLHLYKIIAVLEECK